MKGIDGSRSGPTIPQNDLMHGINAVYEVVASSQGLGVA